MRSQSARLLPWVGIALSVCASPAFCQGASQSSATDPFSKKVTIEMKTVTLREVLNKLATSGGVDLKARDPLPNLKVTVLVKNEPIGKITARLADLFSAQWANYGGHYELAINPTTVKNMDAFIAQENAERRAKATVKIKQLEDGASVPYEQVLATLRQDTSSLTQEQRDTLQLDSSPDNYLLGSTFTRMSSADMEDFWNGKPVRASDTLPADAQNANPSGPPGLIIRNRRRPLPANRVIRAYAIYDPLTGELVSGNVNRRATSQTPIDKLIEHPYPTGALAQTPFGKELLGWNRLDSNLASLQPQVQASMLTGPYFGGRLSMADALEWLHNQTGASIVADAFRTPIELPRRGGTAANWLAGLQETNSAYVRTEGDFVMVRHGGFWRLRMFEIPEEKFASLEKMGSASLDQYAEFAASLSPRQTIPFRVKNAVLMKVNPGPLATGMAALRFYASLPADERRAAMAGTPIPYSQMASTSQGLFVEAMDNPLGGTIAGAGPPEMLSEATLPRLGFLLTPNIVVRGDPPAPGANPIASTGVQMLFGTAATAATQYQLAVDH